MNKKLLFIASFLFSIPAMAQYPGGVRDSIKVWLKANTGITPSPTNTVPQWNEVSGANLTGNFVTNAPIGVAQLPPAYVPVGINFNPHVSFDYTKPNSMVSTNQFPGMNLMDPTSNTILQVIRIKTFTGTGVWMKWQYSNTSDRLGFEVNNGSNPGQLRFDFNGLVRSTVNSNDKYTLATFYTTSTGKGINLNGANNITAAAATVNTLCQGKLSIGNEPPIASVNTCAGTVAPNLDPYPMPIDIAEIIIFKRALSAAERNRIESYLAVKYGITLDQGATAANNYLSANSTIIWNRTNNLPFINNITGIGRDDSSGLVQRQSKSINAVTGLVTIYNGAYNGATAPASNVLNTNNFTDNNSFLLYGDNNLPLNNTRCVSVGGGGFLRMERVWKAQKTGTINQVTLAIAAADVPANTRHLLVSTDSSFSAATTTVYRLDNANSILSRTITFPAANSYFTFASDTLIAHPTANTPLCEGATLQLNANFPGLTTYSWTGPNFTSVAQNPSIIGVTAANAGVYTLNASAGSCVLPPATVTVSVNPRPAPPTVLTPIVYCQFANAVPLTASGANLKWYIQPVGGVGQPAPIIPSTMYEDTMTYWVTQTVAGCESIRSKQDVQVLYKPNGIILGTQESICQGDVDTFTYFGNARNDANFDFKSPAFYSTVLSGTKGGPYVVRFDSAGTFKVRMQINNNGCVSDEMFFTVTVRPSPIIRFNAKQDACVDEVVNVSLYYTTPNVTQYTYNFAGGQMVYGTATGGPYGIRWSSPGTKVITLNANTTGCKARTTGDTIRIHAYPDARIRTVSATSVCTGDSVLFTASEQDSNSRFTWSPDNFFASGNIYSAWGVIKKAGYVRLDVESPWGCRSSDSVNIDAKACCELFFPNVFSPNNDGKNDVFRPVTIGHHNIASFRVLNRWGQTVYESRDERHGWDGTYNGKPQDVGTYYYYIKYQCSSNEYFEQKGEVMLLR